MQISDVFKAAQRATFQDKTIQYRPAVKRTGSLGSVTTGPGEIIATYQANFQILSDALVAQEWGLTVARDAQVTSSARLPPKVGDYIQYDGAVYKVVGHPIYDSHDKLMLELTNEAVI